MFVSTHEKALTGAGGADEGHGLPYTKERIYIPKKYTTFNEKYQYYTLFLVDDKEYELYDENDNKVQSITGKDLEEHVMEKKKEIDKLYSY